MDRLSRGKKLVHLDLKGAPPRIDYLHKLIHLFADLGANGLLIEYEDMFPYEGELKILQSKAHPPYSREEIISIQDIAHSRNLEIIPLVQTFGHLEFVLKHSTFGNLREISHCLGTLNPHRKQGGALVLEMLKQVMELHPKSTTLHIGADEVYMLGEGEESKVWLSTPGHSIHKLFLSHIITVAKGIRENYSNLNLVMWDDMLRSMTADTIKESGLVELVQPMLWDYNPVLDVGNIIMLMEKYKSAGLLHQWAASSFKGSTTVHTCVTSTQRHVDNHIQWLNVASGISPGIKLQGIALTGWQRYDHLSVLCELLPLGLHSLASCLCTLVHGSFTPEAQKKVVEALGTGTTEVGDIVRLSQDSSCSFTGMKLAEGIVQLTAMLESEELRDFQNSVYVKGWFSPYHRQRKIINPLFAEQIQKQAKIYLETVELKAEEVKQEMLLLYPESTAEEWILQHVTPVLKPLQDLLKDIHTALEHMGLNITDSAVQNYMLSTTCITRLLLCITNDFTISESGLVELVQPMLWDYNPVLDVGNIIMLMEKYKSAGLLHQWAASSFKGSTTVHTCVTSTQRHVDNHIQWLNVASGISPGIKLQGIALTGWQRYDHLSVLCELLPLGLHSLASCLCTLVHGSFTPEAQKKVVEALGTGTTEVGDIVRLSQDSSCSFTGMKLAEGIVQLTAMLESEELRDFQNSVYVKGWFSPYHRQRKIINPLFAEQIQKQAKIYLETVELKAEEVKQEMLLLYPESTAEEWILQHVTPVLKPLQDLLKDIHTALEHMGLNITDSAVQNVQ
ncbi:hexosaminidase D [Hoplias malabaricus]|uniref:hexosaminidase D n=1 Tax=Hoplias malabaricus TaxID=27720 RepID=UPI003462A286